MKYYLLLFFIAVFQFSIAQVEYEKGYVVENNGDTIHCLIKNFDWSKSPNEIEIKKSEVDQSVKKTIQEIQSFEIYNRSKYIRKTISIDQSSTDLAQITTDKNPVWKINTVFLQVLVEGKASLYSACDNQGEYFYFSINGDSIQPLICKKYYSNLVSNILVTNNFFRTQLWNDVKCDGQEMKSLQALEYSRGSLMKYFEKYNECKQEKYRIYYQPKKTKSNNLKVFGGLYSSHSYLYYLYGNNHIMEFKNKNGFQCGIELETILPTKRKRFGMVAQPSFEHFTSEYKVNNDLFSIYYNSFNLPIGARFYIINRKDLKLHFSLLFTPGLLLSMNVNSNITVNNDRKSKIVNHDNILTQFGLEYKKWGIYNSYNNNRGTESTKYFWYELSSNSVSLVYKLK